MLRGTRLTKAPVVTAPAVTTLAMDVGAKPCATRSERWACAQGQGRKT